MDNLLQPPLNIPPKLEPLAHSFDADDFDEQMKGLFMQLFESMIRAKERELNGYGAPHIGSFDLVERFAKQDGIAVYRVPGQEDSLKEIYRGWKSRNPRRGTEFLKFYLQLIFPNRFTVTQLWHDATNAYPMDLSTVQRPNDFLTSRIMVEIVQQSAQDAIILASIMPSLRSVLPAKLMALIRLLNEYASSFYMATTLHTGSSSFFTGAFVNPAVNFPVNAGLSQIAYPGTATLFEGGWQ